VFVKVGPGGSKRSTLVTRRLVEERHGFSKDILMLIVTWVAFDIQTDPKNQKEEKRSEMSQEKNFSAQTSLHCHSDNLPCICRQLTGVKKRDIEFSGKGGFNGHGDEV
jgi:hypothetical protein